jgi:hypothetical protein
VRETLHRDEFADEPRMIQHLELRSQHAPIRWAQWERVFTLWIGYGMGCQADWQLSGRRVSVPAVDGVPGLDYYVLDAWYSYPSAVIEAYLERNRKVPAHE